MNWFSINNNILASKIKAETINEAWDKTLAKWAYLMDNPIEETIDSCGLCNLYVNEGCRNCPLFFFTKSRCNENSPYPDYLDHPTKENAALEYLFLLFVKEATK